MSETLTWLPTKVIMPTASFCDTAIAVARDLTRALQNLSPASALSQRHQLSSLTQLATIFSEATTPSHPTPIVPPGFAPIIPEAAQPRVATPDATQPRLTEQHQPITTFTPDTVFHATPHPRVETVQDSPLPPMTYANKMTNPGQRQRCTKNGPNK